MFTPLFNADTMGNKEPIATLEEPIADYLEAIKNVKVSVEPTDTNGKIQKGAGK